jgi:hypothetical protein
MANIEFVSATFRRSDELTRSYSLRERLGAGKFLFKQSTSKYKVTSFGRAVRDARKWVFKNYPRTAWEENNGQNLVIHNSGAAKSLRVAGYWNPLAWIEVFALAWANYATLRYNPLQESGLSVARSYFHIGLASLVHAVAKTINLVFSAIAPVLFIGAVLTVGLANPWIQTLLAIGTAFLAYSIIHHGKLNAAALNDLQDGPADLEYYLYGLLHTLTAMVLGVVNPLIRLWNKASDLYETHPKLAILAGFTVVAIALSVALFPYVGVPALMDFEFGSVMATVVAPVIGFFSGLLSTMPATVSTMLSITTLTAFTLGAMDLTVRGFKEIAGWYDKSVAKATVTDWLDTTQMSDPKMSDPKSPQFLEYFEQFGRIGPTLPVVKNEKKDSDVPENLDNATNQEKKDSDAPENPGNATNQETQRLHILGYLGHTTKQQKEIINTNVDRYMAPKQ